MRSRKDQHKISGQETIWVKELNGISKQAKENVKSKQTG